MLNLLLPAVSITPMASKMPTKTVKTRILKKPSKTTVVEEIPRPDDFVARPDDFVARPDDFVARPDDFVADEVGR